MFQHQEVGPAPPALRRPTSELHDAVMPMGEGREFGLLATGRASERLACDRISGPRRITAPAQRFVPEILPAGEGFFAENEVSRSVFAATRECYQHVLVAPVAQTGRESKARVLLWEPTSQEPLRNHVGHDRWQTVISFVGPLPHRDVTLEKHQATAVSNASFFIDFENRQLARVEMSDPSAQPVAGGASSPDANH